MDEDKCLSDENLEKLKFINKIDTYNIVNKEFDRKRESKKTKFLVFTIILVILLTIILIRSGMIIDIKPVITAKNIFKYLILYYLSSTWIMMMVLIPLLKKKKIKIN